MNVETLRVVTDPQLERRPVIRREDESQVGPLFFSFGEIDLLCGACTFLLIRGARTVEAILDLIVVCPNCGACNEAWQDPGIPA
ncbi:hypothetical protein GCM10009844_16310 [Nocardioides koreensis]|uniref:Uncharacterized protein n=1 Tax=Nocardioides koreensis TaxID=433651 RepID=A0ABP5LBA9_9ACTN